MNRSLPVIALLVTFACASGCGSEKATSVGSGAKRPQVDPKQGEQGAAVEQTRCISNDSLLCANDLIKFPFVRDAAWVSDYCASVEPPVAGPEQMGPCAGVIPPAGETTVRMSHPMPGKLCLAGQVKPGGFALLSLRFAGTNPDATKILEPFDAVQRGITQVMLTIDSPPTQGLLLNAHMMRQRECPTDPLACFYPPNFKFRSISTPGTVKALLADFKSEQDPNEQLDARVLIDTFLQVEAGDFDFCVHDFKLLDSAGNAVNP